MAKKQIKKQYFDEQELKIIKALIKDPRLSDNKISKQTNIPVMTVNRKRKKLEDEDLISYFVDVKRDDDGINRFTAHQLYIIKFKPKFTLNKFQDLMEEDPEIRRITAKYVDFMFIGERDGYPALVFILETRTSKGLINIFNSTLIPSFNRLMGDDSIVEIITTKIDSVIRVHHNYIPSENMEKGKIRKSWPDDLIFVE